MSPQPGIEHQHQPQRGFLTSRTGLVLLGFLAIGGALLFTEHRVHVLGALIWLPLLACPLMHLFMHGGHGGHGGHAGHEGHTGHTGQGDNRDNAGEAQSAPRSTRRAF